MQVVTYLTLGGRCEEAFRFYADVLGAEIEAQMPFAGSPMAEHIPADWRDKVMHGCLKIGDRHLMASDGMPGRSEPHNGYAISLQTDDIAESERLFAALADGGAVTMPLEETFWAHRFGMLVDRFGVPWMVNVSKPE